MSTFLHLFKPNAVLGVEGDDAGEYLQSQFSADLSEHPDRLAAHGLWLSRKGKVEGDGFVLRNADESFLIVSYHCPSKALGKKIMANVIADEVEIEDKTSSSKGLSLWGKAVEKLLAKLNLPCPATGTWEETENIKIYEGRRARGRGFDLIGKRAEIEALAIAFNPLIEDLGGQELDEIDVHFARIEAGIPAIPDEIGPNELPQEGFLEKKSVSFEKGCFLGQEVMARLRSMGGVQRKLWAVEIGEKGLSAPAEIFVEDQLAGFLKTRYSKADKEIGVALIKRSSIERALSRGVSTKPNATPNIQLLHEFAFEG
ncbi:MAG: hypothetical protein VCA36_07530 [Opitutales bacterium]